MMAMITYYSPESAAEGMRLHLNAANQLVLQGGALPDPETRRMIDEHLHAYELACRALARLEERQRRVSESLRVNR